MPQATVYQNAKWKLSLWLRLTTPNGAIPIPTPKEALIAWTDGPQSAPRPCRGSAAAAHHRKSQGTAEQAEANQPQSIAREKDARKQLQTAAKDSKRCQLATESSR